MTTPKIATTYQGSSRYYVHPSRGDRVPGVTSVLNMLPKPFLKAWAAKLVATDAVAAIDPKDPTPDWLTPMVLGQGSAATIDYLKKAPDRNTREAANIGTAAHGVFESLVLTGKVGAISPELEIYARQYEDLLNHLDVTALRTEDTVWSETHGYAGSFDLLAEVAGTRAWVDNKTTRSGVHAEVALQLAAYRAADYLLDGETGEELKHPKADHGLVFHIRPEGWKVLEVPIGDDVFEFFLALRRVFDWDTKFSRGVVPRRPAASGNVDEEAAA